MHGEVAIAQNENILWYDTFSYSDAPYHVKRNSQYLIGSVTKQFTAVAFLKALEDLLDGGGESGAKNIIDVLHVPILSLPFINLHSIFNGKIPDWVNSVSTHHLLTHTSGIRKENETVLQSCLELKPGEKCCYLNAGYVLLRKIIESIVKSPVEKYLKDKLFDPAGMHDTQLPRSGAPGQLKSKIAKLALGFKYNLIPDTTKITSAINKIDFSELDVAGGIISTAIDLVKWNSALYGGAIISDDAIKIVTKRHVNSQPYPFYYGLDNLYYGYGIDIYIMKIKKDVINILAEHQDTSLA
jgi:CubicO group peptidase (beta-lactamase class C family)